MDPLLTPELAGPLHSTTDIAHRVGALIGPATSRHTLWVLFIDGDDRQSPVLMPIDDVPRRPDAMVLGLGEVVQGALRALATDAGPGSVVFVLERRGRDDISSQDREWGEVLTTLCRARELRLRGLYLSTSGGVRPLG